MKFLAIRTISGLRPEFDDDMRKLTPIPLGTVMMVEAKQPRNVKHHRLYWALVNKVFENQSKYATADDLHEAIKYALGYYRTVQTPTREIVVTESITFRKMDQTEFREFFDKVVRLVCQHILPGVRGEELRREIYEMIGDASALETGRKTAIQNEGDE